MGASSQALAALGMPTQQAMIVGDEISTLTATGTTQGTAAATTGSLIIVTAAASQTGVLLSASLNKGRTRKIINTSATDAVVYPPVGSSINGGTTNAGVTVAAHKGMEFMVIDVVNGISVYGAITG